MRIVNAKILWMSTLAAVACLALNLRPVVAGDLTISRTAVAIQTIVVPDGSPLLGLFPPEFELTATGPLVFNFVDHPPRTMIADADFFGTDPFPFLLEGIDFLAAIEPNGKGFQFTAATPFELNTALPIGPGGALVPIRIFTIEDAIFTGDVAGVGFPKGTLFTSPDAALLGVQVNGVTIADGDGNAIPVAFSKDRTVEVIGPAN
jgi:hypothetical protein